MTQSSKQSFGVSYEEVRKPLDKKDLAIIRRAINERGGFDGRVIKEALSFYKVEDRDVEQLKTRVSPHQTPESLSYEDKLNSLVLCCLASAALGEEELSTITGYDRDEFYTTIRRLYHGVRMSIKKKSM
ncbi:hypothetical protein TRP8649_00920 [Pelagimonas phthalicica]|uniref:Uncharacterized protein n=1 Tax=Pelagimonas phthalicica TaxID=1037362 RepID=A0A238J9G3_9RHOB|nr:hypothetical protein [Pelagimonas phthalicica]TDS94645.1 hypothetical protein CLV87_1151 [Pelagimonas phthalicica]SMX26827.1 hypothetical protein TRP8649_00920 [Pelagimonas phthalicica]